MFAKSISICLSVILLVNVVGCGITASSQNQDSGTTATVEKVQNQDSQEKGGKEEKSLARYLLLPIAIIIMGLAAITYPLWKSPESESKDITQGKKEEERKEKK